MHQSNKAKFHKNLEHWGVPTKKVVEFALTCLQHLKGRGTAEQELPKKS